MNTKNRIRLRMGVLTGKLGLHGNFLYPVASLIRYVPDFIFELFYELFYDYFFRLSALDQANERVDLTPRRFPLNPAARCQ